MLMRVSLSQDRRPKWELSPWSSFQGTHARSDADSCRKAAVLQNSSLATSFSGTFIDIRIYLAEGIDGIDGKSLEMRHS